MDTVHNQYNERSLEQHAKKRMRDPAVMLEGLYGATK
jgi:hypothetical protein